MKKAAIVILVFLFAASSVTLAQKEEGRWYLIAGSYINQENALEQQERLYEHRYYSRLMGYPIDGVLYWRVVVSQDKERERLEGMQTLLAEDGFNSFIAYDAPGPERPVKDFEPIPTPDPKLEPELSEETRQFILDLIFWLHRQILDR